MKNKITKDSTLADIMAFPESSEILAKYGVPCLTCPFAAMEMEKLKIGEICERYDIKKEELLKDLNKKTGGLQE